MVDERNNWLDVVEGRRNFRTQGYYCTIQPASGQTKRGITHEEARACERAFFTNFPPWSTADQRRFGTNNLIPVLGQLLVQVVSKSYVTSFAAYLSMTLPSPHKVRGGTIIEGVQKSTIGPTQSHKGPYSEHDGADP